MTKTNKLFAELSYVLKVLKILNIPVVPGDPWENSGKCSFILINHTIASILALILILVLPFMLYLYATFATLIIKSLMVFYTITIASTSASLIYFTTIHRNDVMAFWQRIYEFDDLCDKLALKPNSGRRMNLYVLSMPLSLDTILSAAAVIYSAVQTEFTSFLELITFMYWLLLLWMRILEGAFKLHYVANLTLFKNIYKQLNDLIESSAELHWRERIIVLKTIARCHQELFDLVRSMNKICRGLILKLLQQSVGCMLLHCYILADAALSAHLEAIPLAFMGYAISFAIFNIMFLVVPAANCAEQVRIKSLMRYSTLLWTPLIVLGT